MIRSHQDFRILRKIKTTRELIECWTQLNCALSCLFQKQLIQIISVGSSVDLQSCNLQMIGIECLSARVSTFIMLKRSWRCIFNPLLKAVSWLANYRLLNQFLCVFFFCFFSKCIRYLAASNCETGNVCVCVCVASIHNSMIFNAIDNLR